MWRASLPDTADAVKTYSDCRRRVAVDFVDCYCSENAHFQVRKHILPIFKRSHLYLPLQPNLIYDKHSTLALGLSLESGGLHDWNLAFVPKGSWLPMQVWSNDSFWQFGEKGGKRLLVMNCLFSIRTMLAVLSKPITRS